MLLSDLDGRIIGSPSAAPTSFSAVIRSESDPETWPSFIIEMHQKSGLLADLHPGLPLIDAVDRAAAQWLSAVIESLQWTDVRVQMAGSGVGPFDRPLVRAHMPHLNKMLHYSTLDIGVLRRFSNYHSLPVPDVPLSSQTDVKAHRALADARAHLDEYRGFVDLWRRARFTN